MSFFFPERHPIARKPHQCSSCAYTIPKGEQYIVWEGFYDGHRQRSKLHAECADDIRDWGDEWMPGEGEPPQRPGVVKWQRSEPRVPSAPQEA